MPASKSRHAVLTGVAVLATLIGAIAAAGASTATALTTSTASARSFPFHDLTAQSAVGARLTGAQSGARSGVVAAAANGVHAADVQTVTDSPGNVLQVSGGVVNPPQSDPADLIEATASNDSANITLSAKTVALNDPMTDPNWRNDTYLGWGLDPTFGGGPSYFVYFQLNADGTYGGELTRASDDQPLPCPVSLAFSPTAGYTASLSTACLPGVGSFQWYVYSHYDTVSTDLQGADAFGKALPDFHRAGVGGFAPEVRTTPGYWLAASDGGIFTFGSQLGYFGSTGNLRLNAPIVGIAGLRNGQGYWLVASDGGIFTFGEANFYGSAGGIHLNKPIVGMAATPDGGGYWLVASDGGIFTYGDANFYGSAGGIHLNKPIVGMAATPDGGGYWLVASDGGIFTYGDARFLGSTGAMRLNQPVVGMSALPNGNGYRLVASDGGIFDFGAPYLGGTGGMHLNRPILGMVATDDGLGYRLVASDGGVFTYGDAGYLGSTGNIALNQPMVGLASVG